MSAPISDVVFVTITRETQAVTKAGFGVVLVLGTNAPFAERIREYTSAADMLVDGFSSSDEEYLAATAILAQTPRVEKIKIGKKGTDAAQITTLTFDVELVTANTVDMKVNNIAIATTTFAIDHDSTMTDLATKIQASTSVATAVVTGGAGSKIITITAQTAGVPNFYTELEVLLGAGQAVGTLDNTTDNHGNAEDLAEISQVDDDWYGLVTVDRSLLVAQETARYIETQKKIYGLSDSDVNVYDGASTTDLAAVLNLSNYARTHHIFNETENDFTEGGWMGRLFPTTPGSATWKFKFLNGIVASSTLTSTQRTAITDKNSNLYVSRGGVDMMEEGTMAGGDFIDVIRGTDKLESRIKEVIFSRFVNTDKIPYTDAGVAIIENELRAVLQDAKEDNFIASFTISVPKVADISTVDKAARLLPDVAFTAVLASAIHRVIINGIVTL